MIIVVLLAALVGPFFVDWTAYRQGFEVQASRLLGHRVKVLGTADARLFPVPSLTFTDVLIGEPEEPLMTVGRFEADVELAPLISGEIKVLDMRLDEPELELTIDAEGRLSWFRDQDVSDRRIKVDPAALSIQSLSVERGRIAIADEAAGKTYRLDRINFQLEARSLFGPYKVDGTADIEGAPVNVQVGTGLYRSGDGLHVKLKAVPANLPVTVATDGLVKVEAGRLSYSGAMQAERVLPDGSDAIPVRLESAFQLDSEQFGADGIDLTIGSQDRSLRVEGDALVSLGTRPSFTATLTAKQIDLDRTLGKGPIDPLDVAGAFALLSQTLDVAPKSIMPGTLSLDLPGIVVAGGLIENVKVDAAVRGAGWTVRSVTAVLPGRTGFGAEGIISLTPNQGFTGRVLVQSPQPATLLAWLDPDAGKIGRLEPIELDANLRATKGVVDIDTYALTLGESQISGSGGWRPAGSGLVPQLTFQATANHIDLDRYLGSSSLANLLSRYSASAAGIDTRLGLNAGTIRIAGVDVSGVDIDAAFSKGALAVEKFYLRDLAGAELDASGKVLDALTAPSGAFDMSLFATDMQGLTKVLSVFSPESKLLSSLQQRHAALAPLSLTGKVEATATNQASRARLTLNGDVGRTAIDGMMTLDGRVDAWRDAETSLVLNAQSEDGTLLLRQLGFDVLPIAAADDGVLVLDFKGKPGRNLTGSASLTTGLAEIGYEGAVVFDPLEGLKFSGRSRAKTGDLASSLLLVGRMVPILAGRIPVDLSAHTLGTQGRMAFADLSGSFAGKPIAGQVTFTDAKDGPRLEGDLSLVSVDARFLSELALGADAWSAVDGSDSSQWPSAAFGPPLLGGIDFAFDVQAQDLAWDETFKMSQARFSTRMTGAELSVDQLEGNFLGGTLSGAFSVARSSGEAILTGRAKIDGASLESVVWTREGRPLATGTLNAAFDFEGAGRSIASIMSGLTGGGTASLENGVLRAMNPGAFGAVIRAADAGLELDDARIRSVFAGHLDSGDLVFDEIAGSFTIASGVVRARNVSIDTPTATAFGGASVDLGRWRVQSDWSIKVDPGAEAVAGAEPEVGLVFSGPLDAPVRNLDTAPLLAFLTLRTFEQEVQRVEALQAEILERDRLHRELKLRRRDVAAFDQRRKEEAETERARQEQSQRRQPAAQQRQPSASRSGQSSNAGAQDDFRSRIESVIRRSGSTGNRGDPLDLGTLPPPVDIDRVPGG